MPLAQLSTDAALPIRRKNPPSTFKGAGVTDIVPLLKQNVIRALALRLTVQPTLTGANNTVANTLKGDEWGCITKIRIVANGSDVLLDVSGDDLWWINRLVYGSQPRVQVTLGDGATANPSLDSTLLVPFWLLRSFKPMDGALESFRLTNLQIEITYGTFTLINSAATAYTANPQVEISLLEVEPTAQYIPPFIGRTYQQVKDDAAAQTDGRFVLDSGPYYRGLLLNFSTVNTGLADIANALTNLKLVIGSTVVCDLSGPALLAIGELGNSLNPGIEFATTGIASQTKLRISGSSTPLGWYWLNLCDDGYMTESLSTPSSGDAALVYSTTGAARLKVIAFQLFVNKAAQAA